MPQELSERQGQEFQISFDRERDIFTARIASGASIEMDKDFNALYDKCRNQGMVFDGISDESDDIPRRYYD